GAEVLRRVAFVRDVEGHPVATYVIDSHTYESIYDGYRRRYGKDPTLLPVGEFLTVVSPEVYQSWNPLFVILLTPVVVAFFSWRAKKGKPVPTAHKLLYGILLTAAALAFMALAGLMTKSGTIKVSGLYLATFYMIVTFGELCLSPMGLSLVTKLTPKRLVGLAMGGWFLATAIGNKFSGFFGTIQGLMDPLYFFLLLAGVSALVALFLFVVLSRLDRAIRRYGA
ncbi:MAG TPA: hypothetical protein ENK31_07055, partial [Nannocystis exedens]|nr:hypothetical protein [Nannocystis exedens]